MYETVRRAVCEAVTLEELRDIFQWAAGISPQAVVSARAMLAKRRHRLKLSMAPIRWMVCQEKQTGRSLVYDEHGNYRIE